MKDCYLTYTDVEFLLSMYTSVDSIENAEAIYLSKRFNLRGEILLDYRITKRFPTQ